MLEARKTQPVLHGARPAGQRTAPGSTTQTIDEAVLFDGGAGAIIGLILRNIHFTILTLGLYSFWGKSALRRHFLGQTVFLGSRFEYSGSGARLFAGSTAALLALGALAAACIIAWRNPAALSGFPVQAPTALVTLTVVAFVGMLSVFHVTAFRASRYYLANIKWRGFSMTQTGSASGYACRAVPYSLLVILTLGLAYPFMRNRLQGYKINHARFGGERFRYHGDAAPLLRCWLLPWAVGIALIVGVVMAAETQVRFLANANWLADTTLPVHAWNTFVDEQAWLVLSGFILFSLVLHWYRSVEALHLASNTTLARLSFLSRLDHADFLIAWVNSAMLVVIFGAAGIAVLLAAGAAMTGFSVGRPTAGHSVAAFTALGLAVIAMLLGSVRWFILHNLLAGASQNGLAVKGRIALDRLVVNPPATQERREPTLSTTSAAHPEAVSEPRIMVNNPLKN